MNPSEVIRSQIKVIKQRGLDEYLDRDYIKFQRKFDRLQELLLKPATNKNYNGAFQVFYRIFDAVPLLVNFLSDLYIFRAQVNKPNEIFCSQTRISYNKTNPKVITPGKFNVWYEPMFYGCLPYKPAKEEDFFPPSLTAALETCKKLTDPRTITLMQDFTIGTWQIVRPFAVVNLCFDEVHLALNQELSLANKEYLSQMTANLSSRAGDFVHALFKYYSTLCRTGSNDNAYYILSALFMAIRQYYYHSYGTVVGGLISSSAATQGRGLNIVMIPAAVDSCLILKEVIMERYFLVMPETRNYAIYPCSEKIINHKQEGNFNFHFKNYIKPADRFLRRIEHYSQNYSPHEFSEAFL